MVDDRKVPEGYKLTEVGVIPEDWAHVTLKELTNMIGDGIHTTPKYVSNSDFYFINGNNLGDKKIIIYSDTKCVSKIEYEKHKEKLNEKSLLMSINGTIGNLSFYNNEKVILGKSACYMNIKTSILRSYVYYQLQTNNVMKFYDYEMTGSTIRNLSLKSIRNTPIPVPANEVEQKFIAEALSDTDNLILSIEKLIDKKEKIKQGAMQQLLTGKKRLPGFSGEWEEFQLVELLDYEQPTDYIVGSTDYSVNGIPVLTPGKSFVLGYTNETSGIFSEVPVIIFDDFTTVSKFVTFPFKVKSSAMKMLKLRDKAHNLRLIFEIMQILKFTIGDHKRYWISEYSRLKINLPSIEEQNAIAQVLSDMDNEIEALEEKLEKYKSIKQGMMQELLTGRIRLI